MSIHKYVNKHVNDKAKAIVQALETQGYNLHPDWQVIEDSYSFGRKLKLTFIKEKNKDYVIVVFPITEDDDDD